MASNALSVEKSSVINQIVEGMSKTLTTKYMGCSHVTFARDLIKTMILSETTKGKVMDFTSSNILCKIMITFLLTLKKMNK